MNVTMIYVEIKKNKSRECVQNKGVRWNVLLVDSVLLVDKHQPDLVLPLYSTKRHALVYVMSSAMPHALQISWACPEYPLLPPSLKTKRKSGLSSRAY